MAPHSSTPAWKIPWTEEPGGLQSMGSRRVGQDWATSLSLFTFMHWRRTWQPTPVFLPGESQGQRSLVGCYGVAQSWTWLKWLSSSSYPIKKEVQRLKGLSSAGWEMKNFILGGIIATLTQKKERKKERKDRRKRKQMEHNTFNYCIREFVFI